MEVERGERKERETVAAERVNTNAAGEADVKREAGRRGGALQPYRDRHSPLFLSVCQNPVAAQLPSPVLWRRYLFPNPVSELQGQSDCLNPNIHMPHCHFFTLWKPGRDVTSPSSATGEIQMLSQTEEAGRGSTTVHGYVDGCRLRHLVTVNLHEDLFEDLQHNDIRPLLSLQVWKPCFSQTPVFCESLRQPPRVR
ncbi:unnamed protein product [Pleuronectes platessa]|uniref:Uncharacterized protein n=1 Tax=Pleuronectes platessa TaxID=8262 RepID=A0A9N7UDB1_PLEPL|nr:unnamed protein product [Pleuronectes platessa]